MVKTNKMTKTNNLNKIGNKSKMIKTNNRNKLNEINKISLRTLGFVLIFSILMLFFSINFVSAESNTMDEDLNVVLLNQDPDPAIPGDYVEIRFQVTKTDDADLSDISFELIEDYPIIFDGADTSVKEIDSWTGFAAEDEFYQLHYKVRVAEDAIKYDYKFKLKTSFVKNNQPKSITKEFTLRVGDETKPNFEIGSIRTLPVKLLPDSEDTELNIEILNLGAEKAEKAVAKIDWPEGFSNSYSYSNVDALGNIPGDGSVVAKFYVDLDDSLSEGIYKTTLHLNYKSVDENEFKTLEIPIELDVKEKPVFNISYSEVSVSSGDEVKLLINVTNIGTKKAESVSLRAFKDSSQPFDFLEKSDFVGTLDSGEMGSAVLIFDIEDYAEAKKYFLDLQIRSLKNDQVFLQDESIPITVTGGISVFGNFLLILSKIGILVAIVIGSYLYGKSKKS